MIGSKPLDVENQKYLNEYFKLNLDLSKKNVNEPESLILEIVNMIDSIYQTQSKTSRPNDKIKLVDVIHNKKEAQMIMCFKDKHVLLFKISCIPTLTVVIEEIDVIGTIIIGDILVETGDAIVNTFTSVDIEDKIKLYLTNFYKLQVCNL